MDSRHIARVSALLLVSLVVALILPRAANAQVSGYTSWNLSGSGAPSGPLSGLLASDGMYWGTSSGGGTHGRGTIYAVSSSGDVTVAHSFDTNEGASPNSRLVAAGDGTLLGTTSIGGSSGAGTVFRFNPITGVLVTVHSFTGDNIEGSFPNGIIKGSDQNFYGTTQQAVFKISALPALDFSVLHTFSTTEGSSPLNTIVEGTDGLLYGTMFGLSAVPNQDLARIYSIAKTGGNPTILYQASRSDGYSSTGELIYRDGVLYGTARDGGAFASDTACVSGGNCGTVFRFDLATQAYTVLFSFDRGTNGGNPEGGLTEGSDGFLYGTTADGGTLGGGTLFRIGKSGGLVTLHQFDGTHGASPRGELLEVSRSLYGTTFSGGAGSGVVYRLDLCAADVSSAISVASQGPLKQNRKTGRFTQTLTLKNVDGDISGPLSLVVDNLGGGVALFNASGVTTCVAPSGRPYVAVDVGTDDVFSSRERATVTLEFTAAPGPSVTYSVLAGANR